MYSPMPEGLQTVGTITDHASGLEVRWPTSANHVFGYLTDPYAGNDRPDDPA